MPTILLVCTGNMCRSPMAEGLLRHRLARNGPSDWRVKSAGTWTVAGRPATREAAAVMARRGIDLSSHRSCEVDERLLGEADLVLTMTASHAEALRLEFPQFADKIKLFAQLAGKDDDIEDPIGGTLDDYDACARQLDQILEVGMARLVEWTTRET